jgi:hypothetical protein
MEWPPSWVTTLKTLRQRFSTATRSDDVSAHAAAGSDSTMPAHVQEGVRMLARDGVAPPSVKLKKGDIVLYPSSVEPLVLVGKFMSTVKGQRGMVTLQPFSFAADASRSGEGRRLADKGGRFRVDQLPRWLTLPLAPSNASKQDLMVVIQSRLIGPKVQFKRGSNTLDEKSQRTFMKFILGRFPTLAKKTE